MNDETEYESMNDEAEYESNARGSAALLIGTLITGSLGMFIGGAVSPTKKGRGAAYGALAGSTVGATFLGTIMLGLACDPWRATTGVPGALSDGSGKDRSSVLLGERITGSPRA